jgi:hypothetical protein
MAKKVTETEKEVSLHDAVLHLQSCIDSIIEVNAIRDKEIEKLKKKVKALKEKKNASATSKASVAKAAKAKKKSSSKK